MNQFSRLKNIGRIGQSLLNDQLNTSLVSFFEWGLLNIGNAVNVNIPTSGNYGGNLHQLRMVDEPYYVNGQVWEGFRANWAWEKNIDNSVQPIVISGIYVNSTFIPNDNSV